MNPFKNHGWEERFPNPCVPFPNQPTFVVQFQFWASFLKSHIKDPEPYLPGQVHGLHGFHRPLVGSALFNAFKKNGITNCTTNNGSHETRAWKARLQSLMRLDGGYNVKMEPWISLWQIDDYNIKKKREPMNLQRYDVCCIKVISPVLPLTEESYQEVDRVADTICQALRVQKEDGPGIEVRCESRSNFQWWCTQHRVPKNLNQTLEKRFSRMPQVDQERRLAFAHEMFNELVTAGPQPTGFND